MCCVKCLANGTTPVALHSHSIASMRWISTTSQHQHSQMRAEQFSTLFGTSVRSTSFYAFRKDILLVGR
jgi:hypothetical protein